MKSKHRLLSLFLTCTICTTSVSAIFVPQPAEAVVPSIEWGTTGFIPNPLTLSWAPCKELSVASGIGCPGGGLSAFIPSWDGLAWMAAKVILHEFSQQIVRWIRTGQSPFFSGGTDGSLFVTNIQDFLTDAADNQASLFLREYFGPAWNNLCAPFRLTVGSSIAQSYGRGYGSFGPQARCSLTDVVDNVEDFYSDFRNGGWDAYIKTARYENTPWGLLTLSAGTSYDREIAAVEANFGDFLAGAGFPGLRKCVEGLNPVTGDIEDNPTLTPGPDGSNPLCTRYITQTPGKAIEDQVANTYGQEWKNLGMADEINEILFASFSTLLSWILSGGSDEGLLGRGGSSFSSDIDHAPPPGSGGGKCDSATSRGFGCSCTLNEQCSSDFCSYSTNTCSSSVPECADFIDNDGDGRTDLSDPGCAGSSDESEADAPPAPPQCSDGLDNDGDTLIDYPDDPDCFSATGTTEESDLGTAI